MNNDVDTGNKVDKTSMLIMSDKRLRSQRERVGVDVIINWNLINNGLCVCDNGRRRGRG